MYNKLNILSIVVIMLIAFGCDQVNSPNSNADVLSTEISKAEAHSGTIVYVDATNTSGTEDGSQTNPFDTIQEGINHANPGDKVEVADGTYDELVRTSVDDITVIAPSGATIQPSPSTVDNAGRTRVVDLGGDTHSYDNVTFSGFTIIGPGKDNSDVWVGITVTGANNEASNNDVSKVWTGIQTTDGNANGAVIDGNTLSDVKVGVSVQSQNTSVTNNTFMQSVEVEGMGVGSANGNNTSDVDIQGNTFSPSGNNISFYHGTNGSVDVNQVIADNDFDRLAVVESETVGDANTNEISKTLYTSIQDAVDAAQSVDTVELLSDFTTSEQISLDKSITLEGNNHSIDADFAKVDVTNNSGIGVQSDDVTIQNLKLTTSLGAGWPDQLHGINVYTSTGVTLTNITATDFGGSGILVNGSTVNASDITTANNGWHGINVDQGSNVTQPAVLNISNTSSHDENSPATASEFVDGESIPDIFIDVKSADATVNDIDDQYISFEVDFRGDEGGYPEDNKAIVYTHYNSLSKDDCKKGGYANYDFKNQGKCIQFVNTGKR